MSMPTFSAWPPIPNRSAPEADFDAKMYAIFQHFAGTHRNEMLAFLNWLQTSSVVVGGAINATPIGLAVPAAGRFTKATVSVSGASSPYPFGAPSPYPFGVFGSGNTQAHFGTVDEGGNARVLFSPDGGEWSLGANAAGDFTVYDVAGGATPLRVIAGAGRNALVLDSAGNVCIGDTAASAKLTVAGGGDFSGSLRVGQAEVADPGYGNSFTGVGVNANGRLSASSAGAPAGIFNRNGTDGNCVGFYRGGVAVGTVSVTGTAASYNTSSDYRLKNAVAAPAAFSAKGQVGDLAEALRWYSWKADPGKIELGWFAHELAAVEPRAVTGRKDETDPEGNPVYQGRDDSKLIPVLTAALAEALAEIQSLKARVGALEG